MLNRHSRMQSESGPINPNKTGGAQENAPAIPEEDEEE